MLPNENNWNSFWNNNQTSGFTKISWSKKRIEKVLDKYLKKGMHVLDAGCGSGYFSNMFLEKGCKVCAWDYSKEALEIAKRLTKGKAEYVNGDLLDEKFCKKFEGKFDLIFSDGLLEHFEPEQQEQILKNMKLMKKKNGVIATFVPNKYSFWEVIRPIFMPQIVEEPFTLKKLSELSKLVNLKIGLNGGLNVLPFRYSPEMVGKYFGMILYTINL